MDTDLPTADHDPQPMTLTFADAATLLGVSEAHVEKLIRLDLLAAEPTLSDVSDYIRRRDTATRDVAAAVARVASTPTLELTEAEQRLLPQM